MKKHTSSRSRSRSRSRSHSPSHSREKKYPRSYQNNREFRGYHRGFRRPYHFRGRGRGYFQQRGRYQRGGYNNNNNNFRNNWKNYRQYPQQHQQQYQQKQKQQHQQHQNHSRGRSHSPKKRSGSPHTSHSHQSDRSSSPRSRHQSSSSSHSSSPPKCRSAVGLARQNSKDVNQEPLTSKELHGGGGGGGGERLGGDEEQVEPAGVLAGADDGSAGVGKPGGAWQSLPELYSSSPKRASLLTGSADFLGQVTPTHNQSDLSPKSTNATSNGSSSWQVVGKSKSPSKKSPTYMFQPFSKEDDLDGDTSAMSSAFKRFLEEQNNKKSKKSSRENDMANNMDMEEEKTNGGIFDSVSKKHKKEDIDVSLTSFLKAPPFEEEEGEVTAKPYTRTLRKEWDNGDEHSKPKITITRSTHGLFEERFGKCQNLAYLQVAKDDDLDLDAVAEEIYRSRKQDKAAAIAAALTKREIVNMLRELSPERGCFKGRRMENSISSLTPSPPSSRRNSEREMFMVRGDDSPPRALRKREAKCNVRMDFLGDGLLSSSDILAEERQLSQDLVQTSKKEQEFRSIFQHVKATQSKRSPSELFSQHIVAIVHHSKAQHFPPSAMTLNERFSMYQRRAAEKETMKPRKSPEIHRRIDVSPSAFKKHAHLFEAMKGSEDASYKDGTEKTKGESMDLRVDIERRKKYLAREGDLNQDGARDIRESPDSNRERSMEKSSKHHKKSKKSKKKRSRSSSSSSSSSSHRGDNVPRDESEPTEEGFSDVRLGPQDRGGHVDRGRSHGGFQFRIRGRGWNRGNFQGNNAIQGNSNPLNVQVQPKNEDWDPEYTPKSKKYYLHDDRDGEGNSKVLDGRGRGRGGSFTRGRAWFIIRKGPGGLNNSSSNNSPKWTHDKFQPNGERGGQEEDDDNTQPDHKQGGNDKGVENT